MDLIISKRKYSEIALSKLIWGFFAIVLFFAFPSGFVYSQKAPQFVKILNKTDTPAEKSIAVGANVQFQFCIADGNLKINGWDRSEVRVFIDKGSRIDFRIRQKDKTTDKPVWIEAIGYDAGKKYPANAEKCLSGKQIEIDVPRDASVLLKGQTASTSIDSVKKVSLHFVSGDIFLKNISDGIEAVIYDGDITVGNSKGEISLASTTGNIVAYDVTPEDIGDVFTAKTTSGLVTLQGIEHKQTEVNSISGSVRFVGKILSSGQYNFGTQNGYILFSIPNNSSGKISASYGYGEFASEIPMTNLVKSKNSRAQSLTGIIGKGDATLNLTTFNGHIYIKKQ